MRSNTEIGRVWNGQLSTATSGCPMSAQNNVQPCGANSKDVSSNPETKPDHLVAEWSRHKAA